MNFINLNPVSSKWQIAKNDLAYYFSSAKCYETGYNEFGFLHDLLDENDG